MSKPIRINAFVLAAPSHLSAGLWRHPRDRSVDYHTLDYWTDLARIAERGLFDGIFLADGISLYDVYQGSSDPALRLGVQFPRLDPLLLISAMAAVTEHVGFGVTSSVTYEPPYLFARRMNTLDHLTKGRVGWNVVTSFGDSGTRALNGEPARPHDTRYALADEYMELVYKLWEGSWEDGAARRDKAASVFVEPSKVHAIDHQGEYFRSQGLFIGEPSPQRTPVLYQAGASGRGRTFAAQHAECVFVSGPSRRVVRDIVQDIRARAVEAGRQADDIQFFASLAVIVAPTRDEAQAKHRDYLAHASLEGTATLLSRWTGIDFSTYGLDDVLRHVHTEGMQSAIERYTNDPDRQWTLRDVLERAAIGGGGAFAVGSPEEIADEMQAWVEETGIDGFNLGYVLAHESFTDFADLVVPELQRRGVYKRVYAPGTLREKLFDGAPTLPASHPARQARFWDESAHETHAAT
ncbi:LLM class flavin-dependent oxidoreductase [Caballeronia sp. LZ034LL]|uniref:LLM class flavin-dependent oxidoreductase n=1 Tax=Caballeronia sp. LZ034LL TaxID=3038567 RepID=UPI002854EFDD|nr:LLM class flavin-dependent oxidoreductase [Caballeronia sp. LZ034LL]MDR5836023.1 LLM class flavin-dependent oxidoreductase [Caballeronia sp. LZ034LL]